MTLLPTSYRVLNGCHNCKFMHDGTDWDTGNVFNCTKIKPVPEAPQYGSPGTEERLQIFIQWEKDTSADENGTCDEWEV